MIVEVTAEDIQNGTPRNNTCCPIALALKRLTGVPWIVCSDYARRATSGYVHHMPQGARHFIVDFDMNQIVKPFSFELPT